MKPLDQQIADFRAKCKENLKAQLEKDRNAQHFQTRHKRSMLDPTATPATNRFIYTHSN